MTDLGTMKYFLGLEVDQSIGDIFVTQKKYIEDILHKLKMLKCNPFSTPMEPNTKLPKHGDGDYINASKYHSLIRSFRYIKNIMPDLMLSMGITSRFKRSQDIPI